MPPKHSPLIWYSDMTPEQRAKVDRLYPKDVTQPHRAYHACDVVLTPATVPKPPYYWYSELTHEQREKVDGLYAEDSERKYRTYVVTSHGQVLQFPGNVKVEPLDPEDPTTHPDYRQVVAPKNRREGLANTVQEIINCLIRKEYAKAQHLAVDLKNDVESEANPYGVDGAAPAQASGFGKPKRPTPKRRPKA